jgi:type IV fimbrial biogenesis protein FimT
MSRHRHAGSDAAGFTLVELMITVAVVAILAAIALPSFQTSIRSNRAATATNEMIASLSLARTEAIRSNRSASMCASADGTACGANWSAGWIVWADTNNDNAVTAGERIIRFSQGSDQMQVQSSASVLRFDSRGRRAVPAGAAQGAITVQPAQCGGVNHRRTLIVNASGQVRKDGQPGACS